MALSRLAWRYRKGTPVNLVAPLFGSPSEKGRIGNVHFAMGDNKNAYPGGQNSCRLHLDGVVRNATLEIVEGGKGGYIVRDGQWDV